MLRNPFKIRTKRNRKFPDVSHVTCEAGSWTVNRAFSKAIAPCKRISRAQASRQKGRSGCPPTQSAHCSGGVDGGGGGGGGRGGGGGGGGVGGGDVFHPALVFYGNLAFTTH